MATPALSSSRRVFAPAALAAFISAGAGCHDIDAGEPAIAVAAASLSELAWTPPAQFAPGAGGGVGITTLGTTTYVTYGIQALAGPAIRFIQSTGNNTWTTPTNGPLGRPDGMSLAAFNGSLYLLTFAQGLGQAPGAIALSRYDLATRTWFGPVTLPFSVRSRVVMPGSLAVHQGRLYLVGEAATSDNSAMMFMTSMAPSGTFAPVQTLPFQGSSPSIASYNDALHIVAASGGVLWHATYSDFTWSTPDAIAPGVEAGNAYLARYAKADGSVDCLHVVNVPPIRSIAPVNISWTYTCDSVPGFADAVTIPGSATQSGLMGLAADADHLAIAYRDPTVSFHLDTQSFTY